MSKFWTNKVPYKSRLKRGTEVSVWLAGKIMGPVVDGQGGVVGYRVATGDFWAVVPVSSVYPAKALSMEPGGS